MRWGACACPGVALTPRHPSRRPGQPGLAISLTWLGVQSGDGQMLSEAAGMRLRGIRELRRGDCRQNRHCRT